MKCPPAAPVQSARTLPTVVSTSANTFIATPSRNIAILPTEESSQSTAPIRYDAGEAKAVPTDASNKRNPKNVPSDSLGVHA
jgi:hypothetical protein